MLVAGLESTGVPLRSSSSVAPASGVIKTSKSRGVILVMLSLLVPPGPKLSLAACKSGVPGATGKLLLIVTLREADCGLLGAPLTVCRAV